MLPSLITPLQFFKNYNLDEAMMGEPTLHLARFGLDLVCHFCQASMNVEGQTQRASTCKMVHKLEMVEHYSTISAFTFDVYLNCFKKMFPLFFQEGSRDIFLPSDTFVLRLEIRSNFNVFSSG